MNDPTPDDLRRLARRLGLGATGEYPEGRCATDDLGELKVALIADRDRGRLILHFGKPVDWIGMTAGEAIGFAHLLLRKAKELPR